MRQSSRTSRQRPSSSSLGIRLATTADARAVESVHYASREAAYAGVVSDWPPPGPGRKGRIERWRRWLADPGVACFVGEVDDQIVGFSTIRRSRDSGAATGTAEMPTLYVHPDHWRRGYGRALCAAALDGARARDFDELTLWVLEINRRAAAFYESMGFAFDGATKLDELPRERLLARRYRISLDPSHGAS